SSCGWRIVVLHIFPWDFPSCYDSAMSNLVILFIHFIATLARLLGPGGVRSIVAEFLIVKHQLLIVNRSRQRSPNLCTSDRILAIKPARMRSEVHRFGDRCRERFTIKSWCLTIRDSATMERTPPGPSKRARVAMKWIKRMTRLLIAES